MGTCENHQELMGTCENHRKRMGTTEKLWEHMRIMFVRVYMVVLYSSTTRFNARL